MPRTRPPRTPSPYNPALQSPQSPGAGIAGSPGTGNLLSADPALLEKLVRRMTNAATPAEFALAA
jgi:hypothetical protein